MGKDKKLTKEKELTKEKIGWGISEYAFSETVRKMFMAKSSYKLLRHYIL